MVEFTRHPLCAEDIDELLTIERLCFPTPWSRADFEHEAENPVAYYEVLKVGERIAAYGGMWLLPFVGHITNIAVHPDFRRQSLGKILLCDLLEKAKELSMELVYLEVREHNTVAQSLYKQFGFRFAGVEKGYYPDSGEDAFIMVCENVAQVPKITLQRAKNGDFAILCEHRCVGFLRLKQEGTVCRVEYIEIDRDKRRQGFGSLAVRKVAEYARQVQKAERLTAAVPEENLSAKTFFGFCGFEKNAENKMEMEL